MLPISIPLRPLYDTLADSVPEQSPILVLTLLGALVFGAAFAYRATVYGAVRSTGALVYTNRWQRTEKCTGYGAFAIGVLAGLLCFGEAASVVLCGGAFYLIHLGAVSQALGDNGKSAFVGTQESPFLSDSSR